MTYFGLSSSIIMDHQERINNLGIKPLISFVLPIYNTPFELLNACIASVLDQSYSEIELVIVDDSNVFEYCKATVEIICGDDRRVTYLARPRNGGISAATNDGVKACTGQFIAFIDHDDELLPDSALSVAEHLVRSPEVDIWYSDQVKCDMSGNVIDHFLKPSWSPVYLVGVMYIGHLLVVRREKALGVPFDRTFDGVQDYEFMLRLARNKKNQIGHIKRVLYKWRSAAGSLAENPEGKPGIAQLQCKAAQMHVRDLGYTWSIKPVKNSIHRMSIKYSNNSKLPSVSIIVPTKNQGNLLFQCLNSIEKLTKYPEYDVVVVDNRTTEPFAREVINNIKCRHIIYDKDFNFSDACNEGAASSSGEIILFLNNDTQVIDSDWLADMTVLFEDKKIGAVGATLLYPDMSVQHAGVVLGARGTADHVMRGFDVAWDGYAGSLQCAREVSCVTAACLAIRRSVFEQIQGFDVDYCNHYQDVDLCLKITSAGYSIINAASSRLIHHESVSRKNDGYDLGDRALLLDKWCEIINKGDPYYNSGLCLQKLDYSQK